VVTIEYTLLAGVNDSVEQARELATLLKDYPCKINLIPLTIFPNSGYQRPSGNAVSRFWQVLTDAGFVVTVRTTRGDDIDAACGQLVGEGRRPNPACRASTGLDAAVIACWNQVDESGRLCDRTRHSVVSV
jgi:adenine C2-methylase RlmN of 23S rRNA A2503 and tRNA A37